MSQSDVGLVVDPKLTPEEQVFSDRLDVLIKQASKVSVQIKSISGYLYID